MSFQKARWKRYEIFARNATQVMNETYQLISAYRQEGYQIVLIGIAAKAMTFIRAANINFDAYLDEAPLKINKFVPGSKIGIAPFESITTYEKPTVFYIGAWNFAKEIKSKAEKLCPDDRKGKNIYITSFPKLSEI